MPARSTSGVRHVADRGVHLTGAWFVNNFHHGTFTEGLDPATSPMAGLLRAGLPVSLDTDDPTMIPADLNAEYAAVADTMGYGPDEVVALALVAVTPPGSTTPTAAPSAPRSRRLRRPWPELPASVVLRRHRRRCLTDPLS